MSVYTVQNMILVSGIIAWILLIVVLVFKKENYSRATWGSCDYVPNGVWSWYYPGWEYPESNPVCISPPLYY